jgi:hypothetical protein
MTSLSGLLRAERLRWAFRVVSILDFMGGLSSAAFMATVGGLSADNVCLFLMLRFSTTSSTRGCKLRIKSLCSQHSLLESATDDDIDMILLFITGPALLHASSNFLHICSPAFSCVMRSF